MEDDGYNRPELWLSEGWSQRQQQAWDHPLYWRWRDGAWWEYRLDGLQPLVSNAPVVHVSGYESAAFAAWSNARLPTEFEWEHASNFELELEGNFAERNLLHPQPRSNQSLTDVRRCLGVDEQSLWPLPRLPTPAWRTGRI